MKLTDIFTHTSEGMYETSTNLYRIIAVTTRFGKSLLNITFEYYRVSECFVGGVPAREGGWHSYPIRRRYVAEKPCRTLVFTPEDTMRTKYFAELRECEWTQML
jgi:hypothetical protein